MLTIKEMDDKVPFFSQLSQASKPVKAPTVTEPALV